MGKAMKELYRKSALEKSLSTEQLDKAIVIVSPSFYLAVTGGAVMIAVFLCWAFLGRIHETISVNGIFMNRDGVHTIYSEYGGTIQDIYIDTEDIVHKGQVIASLTNGKKIISMFDGIVTEHSVVEGQVIAAGDYVARIAVGNPDDNVVICYVPVYDGKKIKTGMEAAIYPSTANKQEYGHMKGKVSYVDSYVTSRAEITNQVGVVSLVDSFLEEGPVIEVRLELEKDANTASGYWWSSSNGESIEMVNGTIISADIAIKERRPISLLLSD